MLIGAILVIAEVATRTVIVPASRIERRTSAELEAARSISPHDTPSILLVGNSLLSYGLNADTLSRDMGSKFRIRRAIVEQTQYEDWRFGLRDLWRRGSRPSVAVLMLDPRQFLSDYSRGDYSAWRLVGAPDVIAFGRVSHLHPTEISRLVLSHFSAFYGFRNEMRKILLGRLLPGIPEWMVSVGPPAVPHVTPGDIGARIRARLRELQSDADGTGVRVVLVGPPALESALHGAFQTAGLETGVSVLVPEANYRFDASDFVDGFHLNAKGAQRFTRDLAEQLDALMARSPKHAS